VERSSCIWGSCNVKVYWYVLNPHFNCIFNGDSYKDFIFITYVSILVYEWLENVAIGCIVYIFDGNGVGITILKITTFGVFSCHCDVYHLFTQVIILRSFSSE
jgi:hypothetical protein